MNTAIKAKDLKERPLEEMIPNQYHEFLPQFSKVLADRFRPHRPDIDYNVQPNEGETSSWGPLCMMSRKELMVVKEYLEDDMTRGFI
jgi:hypothetical protein